MQSIGPFRVVPNVAIDLLIDLSGHRYHLEGPFEVTNDVKNLYGLDIPMGWISPLSKVELDLPCRKEAHIPREATYFCFAYPVSGNPNLVEGRSQPPDGRLSFLLYGGFMYFSGDKLIQLNALSAGPGLDIVGPTWSMPEQLEKILRRDQRVQRTSVSELAIPGATEYAYLTPDECKSCKDMDTEDGDQGVNHGALVFFSNDRRIHGCVFKMLTRCEPMIGFCSDCEGDLNYFRAWIRQSQICFLSPEDSETKLCVDLYPGKMFVFGGDVGDRGPGTLRLFEALVDLKKRYPGRVILLLGNRDVNKMRLTSELHAHEIGRLDEVPGPYWVPEDKRVTPKQFLKKHIAEEEGIELDAVTEEKIRFANTKANRLRWMLIETYGAAGDFKRRREELAVLAGKDPSEISDEDVVKSFEDSVLPGGIITQYLEVGQLAWIHGQNLFCHGGIVNANKNGTTCCLGQIPGKQGIIEDLQDWVYELNTWKDKQLSEWKWKPLWNEDKTSRGGNALMHYVVPQSNDSIIMGRHLTSKGMPLHLGLDVTKKLNEHGIRRIVLGHTPHGNSPTIIKEVFRTEGYAIEVVMADTAYSDVKAKGGRGQAVSSVIIQGEGCIVDGVLHTGQRIGYRVSTDIHDLSGDPFVGRMVNEENLFVKNKLEPTSGSFRCHPDGTHEHIMEDRYTLCSVEGFKVEYEEVNKSDLIKRMCPIQSKTLRIPSCAALKKDSHIILCYASLMDCFKHDEHEDDGIHHPSSDVFRTFSGLA